MNGLERETWQLTGRYGRLYQNRSVLRQAIILTVLHLSQGMYIILCIHLILDLHSWPFLNIRDTVKVTDGKGEVMATALFLQKRDGT